MPVTINGNGAISGLGDIDGHDLETATLVVSGDTTIAPQAVGRATLFVDDSANSVGINTTTPDAGVFLEIADGTDPIVSLNNTGNGEVRLGCTSNTGYLRTQSSHALALQTNATTAVYIDTSQRVGINTTSPSNTLQVGFNPNGASLASGGGALTLARNGDTYLEFWTSGGTQESNIIYNQAGTEAGLFQFVSNSFRTFVQGQRRTTVNSNGVWVGSGTGHDFTSPTGTSFHVGPKGTDGANNVVAKFQTQQNGDDTATEIQLINSTLNTSIHGFGFRNTRLSNTSCQFDILQYDGGSNMVGVMSIESDGRIVLNSRSPGIAFDGNDTSDADVSSKTLSDYEEGTWTPTISEGTLARVHGYYTRIGRVVHAAFGIEFPTSSSSTRVRIENFPFTNINPGAANLPNFGCATGYTDSSRVPGLHMNNNTATCDLYDNDGSDLTYAEFSGAEYRGVAIYFTT